MEILARALQALTAAGEDGAGQAVLRVVDDIQPILERLRLDAGQHGAENFFLRQAGVAINVAKDSGRDEIAIGGIVTEWFTTQEQLAFLRAGFDVLPHFGIRFGIHHRPHPVVGVNGWANGNLLRLAHHLIHHLIVDLFHQNRARAGRALLALEAERRSHDGLRSRIQVSGFIHQDGVFAAHFQQRAFEPFLPRLLHGRALENAQTDLLRAGEGDEARQRMIHQGVAHAAAWPRQEVEDSWRQAQVFVQHLAQEPGNPGRGAGGLEDYRIAGDQAGGGHAGHDGAGEVPGWNDNANAQRDVAQLGVATGRRFHRLRAAQTQHLARVVITKINGFRGIGVGFGPALAHFVDHDRAEFVLALANQLGQLEQIARAGLVRHLAPFLEGSMRDFHGAIGVFWRGASKAGYNLAGVRWIERVERFIRIDFLAANHERIGAT